MQAAVTVLQGWRMPPLLVDISIQIPCSLAFATPRLPSYAYYGHVCQDHIRIAGFFPVSCVSSLFGGRMIP